MVIKHFLLFNLTLLILSIFGHRSNSFYLVNVDNNVLSNETYCSNILINNEIYRIPSQCRHHLICEPYYCDEQSFRCIKIRETLCCLNKYLQSNCQQDNPVVIKDLFRSVYFQISIEHGYCEINLERIEQHDQAYCISQLEETTETTTETTTTTSMIRSTFKHFHRRPSTGRPNRFRHRPIPQQNYSLIKNLDSLRRVTIIEEKFVSKSSKIFANFILINTLLFSILI